MRHHWLKSQSLGLIPELYPVFRLPLISASGSSQVKYVNTTFLPEILSRLTEKRKVICMHPMSTVTFLAGLLKGRKFMWKCKNRAWSVFVSFPFKSLFTPKHFITGQ